MLKNARNWDANTIVSVLAKLALLFPDAHCELVYHNIYELSVAVILSAQTTDKSVNLVTPTLFARYPSLDKLAAAAFTDVYPIIKQLGLAKRKAQTIIDFAKQVLTDFNGQIPNTYSELLTLKGIGSKTANVILAEGFHLPGLAVDTHVERVSKRLGIVSEESTALIVEQTLKNLIPQSEWATAHQSMLFFGRYWCLAKKPLCDNCSLKHLCYYNLTKKAPR